MANSGPDSTEPGQPEPPKPMYGLFWIVTGIVGAPIIFVTIMVTHFTNHPLSAIMGGWGSVLLALIGIGLVRPLIRDAKSRAAADRGVG